jgi:hypothetical protein
MRHCAPEPHDPGAFDALAVGWARKRCIRALRPELHPWPDTTACSLHPARSAPFLASSPRLGVTLPGADMPAFITRTSIAASVSMHSIDGIDVVSR